MIWGILLDSGVVVDRLHTSRESARAKLRALNASRREGIAAGDIVVTRRAIGIASMKLRTGLDDGPPLSSSRSKRKTKSSAENASIRGRAWATRRARYGEAGHR